MSRGTPDVVGLGYCVHDTLAIVKHVPDFDDVHVAHVADLVSVRALNHGQALASQVGRPRGGRVREVGDLDGIQREALGDHSQLPDQAECLSIHVRRDGQPAQGMYGLHEDFQREGSCSDQEPFVESFNFIILIDDDLLAEQPFIVLAGKEILVDPALHPQNAAFVREQRDAATPAPGPAAGAGHRGRGKQAVDRGQRGWGAPCEQGAPHRHARASTPGAGRTTSEERRQKNTERRCTSSLYNVCWICSLTWSVRLNISIGSSAASGG